MSDDNNISTIYSNTTYNTINMTGHDDISSVSKFNYTSYSNGTRLYKTDGIGNVIFSRLSYTNSISHITSGDSILFDYTVYLKSASVIEYIDFNDVNINYNCIKINDTTYRIYGYFNVTEYMIAGIDDGRVSSYDKMRFIDINVKYSEVESIIENIFLVNPTIMNGTFENSLNINADNSFYTIYAIDEANNISNYYTAILIKTSTTSYSIKNIVTNGGFENNIDNWTTITGLTTITNDEKSSGNYSLKLVKNGTNYIDQSINTPILGHLYYHAFDFKSSNSFIAQNETRNEIFYKDDDGGQMYIGKDKKFPMWNKISKIQSINVSTYLDKEWVYRILMINSNEDSFVDNVILIDLTATFGSGNEPDKDWCDKHINYFDGTTTIYK